jgi:hypothetical protein
LHNSSENYQPLVMTDIRTITLAYWKSTIKPMTL